MIRIGKIIKNARFKLTEVGHQSYDNILKLFPNYYRSKKLPQLLGTKKLMAKNIIRRKIIPDFEGSDYENFLYYFADFQEYWRGVCEGLGIDFKFVALDEDIVSRIVKDRNKNAQG